MYVNVAVLKETQLHEKRVALVPSVAAKLLKLGAMLPSFIFAEKEPALMNRLLEKREIDDQGTDSL